ncbi:MAG: SH3 domain-containing protein, partial [Muribaculaceae bacterium]|nr:SH3 domain-containing protein [Muribaculaceae bacterium]
MIKLTRTLTIIAALLCLTPMFAQKNGTTERWALPCISVANMRSKPSHSAELSSQALMGMPVRLIERHGDWWLSETPEGYEGWINSSSLAFKTPQEMKEWRSADRAVVTSAYQTRCYKSPDKRDANNVVSDLVNGDIVELSSEKPIDGMSAIKLPDGRNGWVNSNDISQIAEWSQQNFYYQNILDMAHSMFGQ